MSTPNVKLQTPKFKLQTPKGILIGLLGAFALLWLDAPAHACTCLPQKPACEAAWQATAIFTGEVVRVEAPTRWSRVAVVRVLESFNGPGAETIRVAGGAGGTCGYVFRKGERYLVYAGSDRDGQLLASKCSRTRPLKQATEDVAFLRAALQRQEPLGQISGRIVRRTADLVRDRVRDRPAVGAAIVLASDSGAQRIVSDERGRFLLKGLAPGRYSVTVETGDGEYFVADPPSAHLADARGCATVHAFVKPDGRVTGRVLDAAKHPIAGLTIELGVHFRIEGPNAQGQIRAVTGGDGSYELSRVPPGDYVVGVNFGRDKDGQLLRPRVFHPAKVKLAAGERRTLPDFVLPPELRYQQVTGVVLQGEGGPAAGARVFLKGPEHIEGEPVVAGADGRFSIAALAGVEYTVFAEGPRAADATASAEASDSVRIAITDSPPAPLTLVLRPRY